MGDLAEFVASSAAHNKTGSGFCVLGPSRPEGGGRECGENQKYMVSLGGLEPIKRSGCGTLRPFF